jgi:hypothetical protein
MAAFFVPHFHSSSIVDTVFTARAQADEVPAPVSSAVAESNDATSSRCAHPFASIAPYFFANDHSISYNIT